MTLAGKIELGDRAPLFTFAFAGLIIMLKLHRGQRGLSGIWAIMLLLVPASVGIACFCVDLVHIGSIKAALQKAVDAGALSGAMEVQLAFTPIGQTKCENAARSVARLNFAEGSPVETDSNTGTQVDVDITPPNILVGEWGKVRVTAVKRIRNLFAQIIGRPYEFVNCSAVAGPTNPIQQIASGRWFPLAVAWGHANGVGQILNTQTGLPATFTLSGSDKGSEGPRNAWPLKRKGSGGGSGGSGKSWSRMDQFLQIGSYADGHVDTNLSKPLSIGDIVQVENGAHFGDWLGRADVQAALTNTTLYLPVIDGPQKSASGKFKGSGGHGSGKPPTAVVGFIGFKPTLITVGTGANGKEWQIAGNLVKGQTAGKMDPALLGGSTLSAADQTKMNVLNVVGVRLLQ